MLQLARLVIGIKPAVRMLDFLLRTVVPGIPLQDAVCRLVVTDQIHHTALAVKTAKSGIPVPERESSDLAQIVKVSIIFEKIGRPDAICSFIKYGNLQTIILFRCSDVLHKVCHIKRIRNRRVHLNVLGKVIRRSVDRECVDRLLSLTGYRVADFVKNSIVQKSDLCGLACRIGFRIYMFRFICRLHCLDQFQIRLLNLT